MVVRTNTSYANSVDPDKTARKEPSYLGLHCLPFCSRFLTDIHICNNGRVQIQRWNSLLRKLRDKRQHHVLQDRVKPSQRSYGFKPNKRKTYLLDLDFYDPDTPV